MSDSAVSDSTDTAFVSTCKDAAIAVATAAIIIIIIAAAAAAAAVVVVAM